MTIDQAAEIRNFLIVKFGPNFSGNIALWSKQRPKNTEFYGSDKIDALVQSIMSRKQNEDLYVGVGTRRDGLAMAGQGGNGDVVEMSGFFADIDSAADKKLGKQYPVSKDEARQILEKFPLKPTIVIDTGNGLHVHWLFEKAFVIKNADDRARIESASKAFGRKLEAYFSVNGRVIDNVSDLARVCRIPGTFNLKDGNQKAVETIHQDQEARQNFDAVCAFVNPELEVPNSSMDSKRYPLADHDKIMENCSWYGLRIVGGAAACDEPNWYAGASITSRCKNGSKIFHEYSKTYPKYGQKEAEQKFQRAKDDAGPRTCDAIRRDLGNEEFCSTCPLWGKVKSPIQAGQKENGALTKSEFIEMILEKLELFHDTGNTPYATINNDGVRLTYRVESRFFKLWLEGQHYKQTKKSLATNAVTEVINTLSSMALFDSGRKNVYVRLASHDDGIVIDLGNQLGQVIVVTSSGWTVENVSPVKFERPAGMAELPFPIKGDIKRFQNILGLSEAEWLPVLSFLMCCLHPTGPYIVLIIEAEQGAGKSVLTWAIKYIIDPSKVSKARLPNKLDDLMVMARENWLLAFDNVSSIPQEMSNDLCVMLTGGGHIARKLYTNDDAHIADYCRPITLNGISGLHLSPDLVDRAISLRLTRKTEKVRKTEKELKAEFEQTRPEILGGLLDIIVVALRGWEETLVPADMRMADCAQWLAAGEPETKLPQGTLVDSVILSQTASYEEAMETDALAQEIINLVIEKEFAGTMAELFVKLNLAENRIRFMPKTPSQLSKTLRRQKPAYEHAGLMMDFPARLSHGQHIRIWLRNNGT